MSRGLSLNERTQQPDLLYGETGPQYSARLLGGDKLMTGKVPFFGLHGVHNLCCMVSAIILLKQLLFDQGAGSVWAGMLTRSWPVPRCHRLACQGAKVFPLGPAPRIPWRPTGAASCHRAPGYRWEWAYAQSTAAERVNCRLDKSLALRSAAYGAYRKCRYVAPWP